MGGWRVDVWMPSGGIGEAKKDDDEARTGGSESGGGCPVRRVAAGVCGWSDRDGESVEKIGTGARRGGSALFTAPGLGHVALPAYSKVYRTVASLAATAARL